jgi:hypothetical protein
MKIYSPIISGSVSANILSGSFDIKSSSGSVFVITNTGLIGINKTNPSRSLDVGGAIAATTYYGDGSQLTGIGSTVFPFTGSATFSGSVIINGVLQATEKSFVIDHQEKPGQKLVYGVLEGPEHAVYCRGRVHDDYIELPEEWSWLVDEKTLTVQLTPVGHFQTIYVSKIKDNKVYLKCEDMIDCYYFIQGTRKDINKLQTIQ